MNSANVNERVRAGVEYFTQLKNWANALEPNTERNKVRSKLRRLRVPNNQAWSLAKENLYRNHANYRNAVNAAEKALRRHLMLSMNNMSNINYRVFRGDYDNNSSNRANVMAALETVDKTRLNTNAAYKAMYEKILTRLALPQKLKNIQQKINAGNVTGAKNSFNSLEGLRPARGFSNSSMDNLYNKIVNRLNRDIDVYSFWGLGCSGVPSNNLSSFVSSVRLRRGIHERLTEMQVCNESLGKTLKHITLQCATPFNPRLTRYTNAMKARVEKSIEDPFKKYVFLVGHSYGGEVVNVVCKLLNSHPNVSKLRVITFGSIYIAPPSKLSNITIKQYMFPNDVALRCQRIRPSMSANFNRTTGITWLAPPETMSFKKQWWKFWRMGKEWRVHCSYDIYRLTSDFINSQVPPG